MKRIAAAVTCALCVVGTVGGVWLSRPPAADYGPTLAAASDVYAVMNSATNPTPTRWYVAGFGTSDTAQARVERIPSDAVALPWTVHISYSLDGPNVDADTVRGASGLVGISITVAPSDSFTSSDRSSSSVAAASANDTIPVVAFSIPASTAENLSADAGVSISAQGSNMLVTAAGQPSDTLHVTCYMNAKDFTMSPVALAVLPTSTTQSDTAQSDIAQSDTTQLTDTAAALVDSLTDAGSSAHQQLIDQLKALRERERELNKSVVAERESAHSQAFHDYMAAYVGSYTSHLSGSIGTSTQLPALMGTAGELSGDTPVAQAVLELADAVNNVSAAHQHAGAVQALDEVIRRIQQQGTTGLVDDLTAEAASEAAAGAKQYTEGQNQLSAAMIPYSMAYTDEYTANLSMLTGGSSSGAAAYQAQAIASTDGSDALVSAQAKVDTAMATLATACEHTGKSTALKQILLRFSDQFASTQTQSDGAQNSATGLVDTQAQSFYGKAKAAEAQRKAEVARKQAEAAKQQNAADPNASLVDDRMQMSAGDVMSYASGLTSALGSGGKSSDDAHQDAATQDSGNAGDTAKNADKTGTTGSTDDTSDNGESDTSDDNATGNAGDADNIENAAPILFGFGNNGTLLKHDMSRLIGETVQLGDAGDLIAQAIAQLEQAQQLEQLTQFTQSTDGTSTQQKTAGIRYLIVIPTV
ncbi:hypothetical protein [Bifidobacterium oedipodis]|uniref:Tubuliform spidroin n=1 Tax=Bifidobacterium oedipodis TaxID=2675322 RepID=A0A7Y0HT52_9BIFI|nr:hypothetical protein [Bifidobacterium sp. DSM 109957]NMM93289.1 hypothetical protein [Bifidobacterium sp. DSM 109957]